MPRADHAAPAAGRVGAQDVAAPHDDAAGREVGPAHDLAQLAQRHVAVGQHGADRGADLAQVVRRERGRHADRDAVRAVADQVREARRQHRRLHQALVVVGLEVDRLLVEVGHHLDRDAVHARLRVAHGRGRVAVDRAEVALAVDQRVAQREGLRHAHERRIDDRLAVRVVLARGVAGDVGALAILGARAQLEVVQRHEDAALRGLEPVAHVGQRARVDDAERVVQVRLAHLALDLAQLDAVPRHGHGRGQGLGIDVGHRWRERGSGGARGSPQSRRRGPRNRPGSGQVFGVARETRIIAGKRR